MKCVKSESLKVTFHLILKVLLHKEASCEMCQVGITQSDLPQNTQGVVTQSGLQQNSQGVAIQSNLMQMKRVKALLHKEASCNQPFVATHSNLGQKGQGTATPKASCNQPFVVAQSVNLGQSVT